MNEEVVRMYQRMLFKGEAKPLPAALVAAYRRIKFASDKLLAWTDPTPFQLAAIADIAGVLGQPSALRRVEGEAEGEDDRAFGGGLDRIPDAESEVVVKAPKKKKGGRPKGSKNKKKTVRRKEPEAELVAVEMGD